MQALLEEVTKKHDIDLEEVGEKLRVCIIMCVSISYLITSLKYNPNNCHAGY